MLTHNKNNLSDILSRARIVSFDFDGVLVKLFLGKLWKKPRMETTPKEKTFITRCTSLFEKVFVLFSHGFRLPIPGGKNAILKMKAQGKKVYLLTSRDEASFFAAEILLKLIGYYNIFDKVIFNAGDVNPYYFKDKMVKEENIDIHIDDSTTTLKRLSKNHKSKAFIFFNYYKKNLISAANVFEIHSWKEFK